MKKTALCLGAGALALAAVSQAGHGSGLRGLAPVQAAHHTGSVVPSWQEARLLAANPYLAGPGVQLVPGGQVAGPVHVQTHTDYIVSAPTRVAAPNAGHTGLRGLSDPDWVRLASRPSAATPRGFALTERIGVRTQPDHTRDMLDWQENTTSKTMVLLANRASGLLQDDSLYIGAGVRGGLFYQKTDRDGQFPILSRFPFFSNRTDDESGVFAIQNAALSFTSTFGDWTTIYLQPEYSETEYPLEQDEFQLRKAFVVFGNLERSPFYAAFGRKTIDFGNFDSYNPFTHTEAQHYFWAVSDQPVLELGFYNDGWKVTGSAFSGGRQLRTAFADEDNNIANYAFNAEKEFRLANGGAFTLGGGYLHDSIYRDNWTAHTFLGRRNGTPPANLIEGRNSIVTGFAEYNSPFLDAMVDYTTTLEPWGAAIPQTPDGVPLPQYLIDPTGSTTSFDNIDFDQNLEVITAQVRVKPELWGKPLSISAVGSWGFIGDEFETQIGPNPGDEISWEENQQHVLGLEYPVSPYLDIGAEYVYNKGFIPFVAPQRVSNEETEAHAVNIGIKARF